MLPENIGYMHYDAFTSDFSDDLLDHILTQFKDCKGVIIDIRSNGGGSIINVNKLACRFSKEDKVLCGYTLYKTAELSSPDSLLSMEVSTDQPGVQFYIGNFLGNGPAFRNNTKQVFHGAFCLETQTEPDCINHGIGFYEKGEIYTHSTVYSIKKISKNEIKSMKIKIK